MAHRNAAGDPTTTEATLFDLLYDPNEAHDLGDPAHADVLEEMRDRLETWVAETDDPLLEGPVPAPVGAEIDTRDQLSADDPTTTVT